MRCSGKRDYRHANEVRETEEGWEMRWAKDRIRYWFLDYGEMVFVLSILIVAVFIIGLILTILLAPKTAIAGDIVNFRTAQRMVVPVLHSDVSSNRDSSSVVKVYPMEITAYSPRVCETDGDPLTMASGQRVRVGAIAADLRILPFGSLVRIPQYNNGQPCVVLDTGGAIHGLKLDIFLWSTEAAIHWGRRKNVPVEILRIGW